MATGYKIPDLSKKTAALITDLTDYSIEIGKEDSVNKESYGLLLSQLALLIGSNTNFFVSSIIRTTLNYLYIDISDPSSQTEELTVYGEGFGNNSADLTFVAKKLSDNTEYTKASFGTPTMLLGGNGIKMPISFISVSENENIYIEITKNSETIKTEIISIVYTP
jgi:hypothetical protein